MLFSDYKVLEGWGRKNKSKSLVYYPDLREQIPDIVSNCNGNHILAHGRGRSYGDVSLNRGHFSIDSSLLDRVIEFDRENGLFTCEPGLTLEEIIRIILPHGWFLPVTPGTQYPSIGGCIGCDVHGKNHHLDGSISSHVKWLEVILASGETIKCSKQENPDVFYATAGGIGLTGFITKICLKLKKVETSYIAAQSHLRGNLETVMSELESKDKDYPFAVAWIDCLASGSKLGRGEVLLGTYARYNQLPAKLRSNPLLVNQRKTLSIPVTPPVSMVNPLTSRIFNELYYCKGKLLKEYSHPSYVTYFYPLDVLRKWNHLYGPKGFIQYQFVSPFETSEKLIRKVLKVCQDYRHPSALAVLKRMGKGQPLLSFPRPGWTLALDIPVKRGLNELTRKLDQMVVQAGGRIYLGKDSALSPEIFRAMYPEFPEWLRIKKMLDPDWTFSSDMSRRLKMHKG